MFFNTPFFKKKKEEKVDDEKNELSQNENINNTEDEFKGHLYEKLQEDYRVKEGLKACMNCGVCTAVCPAAEFYRYNPKNIVNIVQRKNEDELEALLKSDTIWYCGECMSCVTRCPRANVPGLIIMALRKLAMESGYYMESEKGRQQYVLVKDLCNNILTKGYCVYPRHFGYEEHKEFGTVGKWICENLDDIHKRLGSNLDGDGPGGLKNIFDVTGATKLMNKVLDDAHQQAQKENLSDEDYFKKVYTINNSNKHLNIG